MLSIGRFVLPAVALLAIAAGALTGAITSGGMASAGSGPFLAIDADPTNGSRPCSPVDATRTGAPTAGSYDIAVCLVNGAGSPDAFEFRVIWSGGVATAPEVADAGDALADNPDFNEGAAPNGFGTNWSCNSFGLSFPVANDPSTAGVNDARIVCNEKTFAAGTMTAEPGLLGTLHMTASGTGFMTFEFGTDSNFNSPAFNNINCASVTCVGATVEQGSGGTQPSPTATFTPTSTSTPCTGNCPTPSPTNTVQIGFATVTFTATPPVTGTPAPGETTVPGDGGGEPGDGGGAGAGGATPPTGVRPPDTGTGSGGAGTSWWVPLIVASGGVAVLMLGMGRQIILRR
jgi:hypothetical protein